MKKQLSMFLTITSISTTLIASDIKYEVGTGRNYTGLIGITANKMIKPNIELYGGLGYVGAVIGTKYYINDNIRLNLNYGTQGKVAIKKNGDNDYDFSNGKIVHGINIGIDYIWNNGISLGLTYMVTSTKDKYFDDWERDHGAKVNDNTNDISVSLGYRF